MLVFAIVLGLSMGYEVFLVSRVCEGWSRTRDAMSDHERMPVGVRS